MKKGPTKNSNTENTLETLPQDKEPQLSKPMNQQNFAMTSTESNATTGLESAHEKKVLKYPKKLEPSKSSDQSHLKLINSVRETFLTIRQKTLSESPSSILNLKKSIPFEDPEDTILSIDPVLLLQYIKQIFDKVLENKNEAEKEILQRNEHECGDYESMLQKLEAEVRQHIRIEQQLKLYVESVQSKLEEHEKEGDLSRVDLQKELEILQQDNITLSEKIKDYEEEVKSLKKKLSKKVEAIEKLERQIENIPILKKMIREMDKVLDAGPVNRSLIESTMRGSQRSNKDIESSGYSNTFSANESRMRKSSHPVVGSHSQDKHKESNDHIKIKDVSALGDKSKYKEGSIRDSKIYKEGSKFEGHSLKSTARLEEKNEEPEEVPKKMRASVKGESNRRESRERHTDQDGLNGMKNKEDIIEPSRFSVGNAFKAGMEEFLRKSFEKEDVKAKKKTTESSINRKTTKVSGIENTKDKIGYKAAGTKASRPGTAGERLSHNDHTQHSADPHFVEAYKSKEIPSKKHAHDRSQSVEPKKKFLRQHKSRGSINEDEVEEHHRKQASFSGHQRASGHAKQNQSGSGVFSKSHS